MPQNVICQVSVSKCTKKGSLKPANPGYGMEVDELWDRSWPNLKRKIIDPTVVKADSYTFQANEVLLGLISHI